mmetsp:Transcript_57217/g.90964  ORF Transcript_57217/g.90964 Transcript_57217/m.90964 type:complete len:98 (+) Transcript_57217:800-1093(+)
MHAREFKQPFFSNFELAIVKTLCFMLELMTQKGQVLVEERFFLSCDCSATSFIFVAVNPSMISLCFRFTQDTLHRSRRPCPKTRRHAVIYVQELLDD